VSSRCAPACAITRILLVAANQSAMQAFRQVTAPAAGPTAMPTGIRLRVIDFDTEPGLPQACARNIEPSSKAPDGRRNRPRSDDEQRRLDGRAPDHEQRKFAAGQSIEHIGLQLDGRRRRPVLIGMVLLVAGIVTTQAIRHSRCRDSVKLSSPEDAPVSCPRDPIRSSVVLGGPG
jgi:hypothetical protein